MNRASLTTQIKNIITHILVTLLGGKIYSYLRIVKKYIIRWFINPFPYCYFKVFKSSRTFQFQGKNYKYFYNLYNTTWENERAVEIPIVREILQEHQGKMILEVGNVIPHYFDVDHDVVDKYENAINVINQDVIDYHPTKKYDLIISISTLEHVGWDESPREPEKILRAIDNLKSCLVAGGKMVVTFPLGYNSAMDKFLLDGRFNFIQQYTLRRTTHDNQWEEIDENTFRPLKFGYPYPSANGLVIGILYG
jgi:hypothetical protein